MILELLGSGRNRLCETFLKYQKVHSVLVRLFFDTQNTKFQSCMTLFHAQPL